MTTPDPNASVPSPVSPPAAAPAPAPTAIGFRTKTDEQVSLDDIRSRIAPPAKAPERIGAYRITGVLGEGGMGVVYQAVQLSLDRIVALKVVRGDLARKEAFVGRFLREAKVAARIDHPNVVTIYDTGEADGHLYMALQFVPGGDLATRIKRDGKMKEDEALRIIAGCARGLIAIHAAGLVHRDIKPSNIFLTAEGTPKIGDLGLARNIIDDEKLTFAGDLVGTPSYMAPEQAKGSQDIDHRADIYSLGTSLYHLLTGRPPFQGSSPFLIGHQVIAEVPQDPRELNRAMSPVMAAIIHHAMRKDRTLRYQSAEELLVDVELLRSGKLPRFARVTVMDDERRASQTGSLATMPMPPQDGAQGRSFVPVAVGAGMLVGVAVALAVGLGLAQRTADPVPTLPSAAFPTAKANTVTPLAFPPSDLPPQIQEEALSTEFLAANEPAERPVSAQPARHVQPAPRPPTPLPVRPQAEPVVAKPPTLPAPLPPAPFPPAPLPTLVVASAAPAPPTPALPAPVIEVDPPIPTQVDDTAALRVVREAVVRVPLDGSAPTPAPALVAAAPVVAPSARNNLGPTSAQPVPPTVVKSATEPSVPPALTAPTPTPALTAPAPAPAPVVAAIPPAPALVEKSLAEALVTPTPAPVVEVPGLPSVQTAPAWAAKAGSDRYGSWADLTIGTVTQRFRLCPAGAVLIGSPPSESGRGNDETAHRAIIAQPYWLADTECTQGLWRTVMGKNPSSVAGDELPVDQVSFQRVQEFLRTATEKSPGVQLRLPSEIEWEAACRAGSRGPYTGGFELRKLAWYRATAGDQLAAVASRQPNTYGLFDVHGNVWEWCQDASRSYPPDVDGLPVTSHAFVYRGGSYADTAEDCRAARRGGNQTGDGAVGIGFRLAISAEMR